VRSAEDDDRRPGQGGDSSSDNNFLKVQPETDEDTLFVVVPGTTSYRPKPTFLLPDEDLGRADEDHRRGPGPRAPQGPQDAAAPGYWQAEARQLAMEIAADEGEVSADRLRERYPHLPSASGSAWGALFRTLAREGKLLLVGYRPSTTPSSHGRVVGVWRLP